MTPRASGLRERKKQATRETLRAAALRLALEHGPDNVRVDDIAAAAGVSPRTYNNYYASREQAIVAAITGEREARVAAAVAARPAGVPLADAVIDAVVGQYTEPAEPAITSTAMSLLATHPGLRAAFAESAGGMEAGLGAAIGARLPDRDPEVPLVLAASVAAAVRVALRRWVRPVGTGGLVVVSGSLPELLRAALAPLRPALDAADPR